MFPLRTLFPGHICLLSHLLGQGDVAYAQCLVLVLADILLHLLNLTGREFVAALVVLVVIGKLFGHLFLTVICSRCTSDGPPLQRQKLHV